MSPQNAAGHVAAELARARSMRASARRLAEIAEFDSATSRLYYSAVHACRALLALLGIEPRSHRGLRHLVSLHFIKTGKVDRQLASRLSDLQEAREGSDYLPAYRISPEEYAELATKADAILAEAERVTAESLPAAKPPED